ncbi:MAG: diphthine synthase [Archaeoglobaceae archaeon]
MLILVGLGLWDIRDISIRGLEAAKKADKVYVEYYTSLFFSSPDEIAEKIGKRVEVLERKDLEEDCIKIVEEAKNKDIVILIPGDPMVATTHSILRVEAKRRGVESKIIHSSSIMSAVCGATGLQSYRFGKTATVSWTKSRAPLDVIEANRKIDAHTLLLLDLHPKPMQISEAVDILASIDSRVLNFYAVGLARIGESSEVYCDTLSKIRDHNFGATPHCIVVLAPKLHIVEYEYLSLFANAPKELEQILK